MTKPITTRVLWCPEYVLMGFETTEKSLMVAADLLLDPIDGVEITDPYLTLDEEEVLRVAEAVHDPRYVDDVLEGRRLGVHAARADMDRAIDSVIASSAGMVSGARAVANGERRVVSLSAGMHHAGESYPNGFCTFNGLAMAAREVLDAGIGKVVIVDFDAHHGGGTEDILTRRMPTVGHIDLAVDPFDSYRSKRTNTDMLTLPRGKKHRGNYLPTIEFMLDGWVETHGAPEVVIYNAGMDPHQDCFVGGRKGISTAVLRARERMVADWALGHGASLLVGLAGGYVGEKLTPRVLTDLHRSTIEEVAAWR